MAKVLIIGGNSDIGLSCAKELSNTHDVTITIHKPLNQTVDNCKTMPLNVLEFEANKFEYDFDIVLYIAGKFDSSENSLKSEVKNELMDVNFNAPVKILSAFATKFNERGYGTIGGVSSVAAVRGKASTVIYGAAKGGFDNFLGGLRSFYHPKVKVITFRLGYVDTKMTSHLNLPKSLTAHPDDVAKKIAKTLIKGKRNIVYIKPIFRPIAFIIKSIPEGILKRLKL